MSDQELKARCYAMGYSDGEVGAFYDGYEKGRADAIDECKKTVTDYCGGLPNNNLISALEQLKEKNRI